MKSVLRWLLPPIAGILAFVAASIGGSRHAGTQPGAAVPATASAVATAETNSQPATTNPGSHPDIRTTLAFKSKLHRVAEFAAILDAAGPGDFPYLLKALLAAEPAPDREMVNLCMHRWLEWDPRAASEAVRSIPDPSLRTSVAGSFARAWGRKDLPAARAWAAKNVPELARMSVMNYFRELEGLASGQQPPTTLEEALREPDFDERSRRVRQFFTPLMKADPAAVAKRLGEIPDVSAREDIATVLSSEWSKRDPLASARWFASDEAQKLLPRSSLMSGYAVPVADKDPVAGLALVREINLDAPWNRFFAARFLEEIFETRKEDVLALLRDPKFSHPKFTERFKFAALEDPKTGFTLAVENFQATKDAADLRDWGIRGVRAALEATAAKQPETAAQLALTAPAEIQSDLLGTVGGVWCTRDARSAVAWAANLPEGTARNDALREFNYHWASQDSQGSAAWMDKLPTGAMRNEAVRGFVFATMATDADGALTWARTISDPALRESVLRGSWRQWSSKNSGPADSWIERSSLLTPEEKKNIQARK